MTRNRQDRHHILNNRIEWSARPESSVLRETMSLIPLMDRSVHEQIHRECPPVPTLCVQALQRVVRTFRPTHDTFETMDNLMFAIERASDHPKAHPIERQIASLAIQSIDMQRPYVRDGIILPNGRNPLYIV